MKKIKYQRRAIIPSITKEPSMINNILSSLIGIGAGLYLAGHIYIGVGGDLDITLVMGMAKWIVVVGVMYWGWNWKSK